MSEVSLSVLRTVVVGRFSDMRSSRELFVAKTGGYSDKILIVSGVDPQIEYTDILFQYP